MGASRGVRDVLGLAGTLVTQGPERYRGHQGIGAPRGVGAVWGVRECIGGSRNSRYSGTRRGIGASGTLGSCLGCQEGIKGCRGVRGVFGG